MRRIIHNTTAIAACLSLMAPHLAMAQTEAPAEAPAAETCADGSAAPCAPAPAAEAEPADEPEAAAEEPAEAEAPAAEEAPAEQAPAEEPAEESPAAEAPDQAAPTDTNAAAANEAPAAEAPASEAPAVVEAPTDAEDLKAALEAEEAEAEDAAPAADATAEAPAEDEAAPAQDAEVAPNSDDATAAEVMATEPNSDPAAQQSGEPAIVNAPSDADDLKAALEAEEKTAAGEEATAGAEAATPEAEASADAEAKPEPKTAEAAPEENAKETEAAKEAAAGGEAPVAAALSGDPGEAEVTEETVTEENSRSSSEDFATNLSDALEGAAETQDASDNDDDDDDDKRDLAKAVLLGLGGVAVGSMLANNREVALSSPDRVVVTRADGSQQVIKDEVALLRQPGSTVTTENFNDGSSRTIVNREDGSQVVTIRDADLRVLRRTLVTADGRSQDLIDDTAAQPVDIANLPAPAATSTATASQMDEAQLREALMTASAADRRFTLSQIRDIAQVRSLVAPVNIDSITFDTGSAAIKSDQAEQLSALGNVIRDTIAENPGEMFMIEGYTDTVGPDAANLALSDRRAESVALALTEYFDVPPENMVVQGYGEEFLLVNQEGDLRENRRASVRRITELLQTASN